MTSEGLVELFEGDFADKIAKQFQCTSVVG